MRSELVLLVATALAATACTWETDLPAEARAIPVVAERELLVTDDGVLASLGRNAGGPLSFAAATAAFAKDGAVHAWLAGWSARLAAEGRADRATALDAVTCRWLRATPANACDATCASCADHVLAAAATPFRLAAVVNRTDLTDQPDRASPGGEGRLVFALTEGPADDAASPAVPLSVIFEYAQEGTARAWTERWHALGAEDVASFPSALADVANGFVARGTLARVRTADAWTGPLRMDELHLESGALVAARLRNTVAWERIPESEVRAFASAHDDALAEGTVVFPETWWTTATTSEDAPPAWVTTLSNGDRLVRATCTGCHARSGSGFHVQTPAHGRASLSPFLRDEAGDDELTRRTVFVQLTLSGLVRDD